MIFLRSAALTGLLSVAVTGIAGAATVTLDDLRGGGGRTAAAVGMQQGVVFVDVDFNEAAQLARRPVLGITAPGLTRAPGFLDLDEGFLVQLEGGGLTLAAQGLGAANRSALHSKTALPAQGAHRPAIVAASPAAVPLPGGLLLLLGALAWLVMAARLRATA
jgi:hypothetical protein